jgi:hypothetical protein
LNVTIDTETDIEVGMEVGMTVHVGKAVETVELMISKEAMR